MKNKKLFILSVVIILVSVTAQSKAGLWDSIKKGVEDTVNKGVESVIDNDSTWDNEDNEDDSGSSSVEHVDSSTDSPSQSPRLPTAAPTGQPGQVYDSELVLNIQQSLKRLGYSSGRPDGKYGPATRSAIIKYQKDHGLPVDGVPSPALALSLNSNNSSNQSPVSVSSNGAAAQPTKDRYIIKNIQKALRLMGHRGLPPSGRMGSGTEQAIKEFQKKQGLSVNGQPSLQLLAAVDSELKFRECKAQYKYKRDCQCIAREIKQARLAGNGREPAENILYKVEDRCINQSGIAQIETESCREGSMSRTQDCDCMGREIAKEARKNPGLSRKAHIKAAWPRCEKTSQSAVQESQASKVPKSTGRILPGLGSNLKNPFAVNQNPSSAPAHAETIVMPNEFEWEDIHPSMNKEDIHAFLIKAGYSPDNRNKYYTKTQDNVKSKALVQRVTPKKFYVRVEKYYPAEYLSQIKQLEKHVLGRVQTHFSNKQPDCNFNRTGDPSIPSICRFYIDDAKVSVSVSAVGGQTPLVRYKIIR